MIQIRPLQTLYIIIIVLFTISTFHGPILFIFAASPQRRAGVAFLHHHHHHHAVSTLTSIGTFSRTHPWNRNNNNNIQHSLHSLSIKEKMVLYTKQRRRIEIYLIPNNNNDLYTTRHGFCCNSSLKSTKYDTTSSSSPSINDHDSSKYNRNNNNNDTYDDQRDLYPSKNRNYKEYLLDEKDAQRFTSLPRLYVGQQQQQSRQYISSSSTTTATTSIPFILSPNTIISLSSEQSHYLSKVLRLFSTKKKRKFGIYNTHDYNIGDDSNQSNIQCTPIQQELWHVVNESNCVRLFDGINGEWLARVYTEDDDDRLLLEEQDQQFTSNHESKQKKKKKGAKKKKKYNRQSKDTIVKAQCLFQMRQQQQQQQQSSSSSLYNTNTTFTIEPWLLFAPIKSKRAKLLIEKCTELGCNLFCPIISERTDVTSIAACVGQSSSPTSSSLSLSSSSSLSSLDPLEEAMYNSQLDSLYQVSGRDGGGMVSEDGVKNKDVGKLEMIALEAAEQSERLSVPNFVTNLNSFLPVSSSSSSSSTSSDENDSSSANDQVSLSTTWDIKQLLEHWISVSGPPENSIDPTANSATSSKVRNEVKRKLFICRERKDGENGNGVLPVLDALDQFYKDEVKSYDGDLKSNEHEKMHQSLVVGFVIGPEGGWSPQEESLFDDYTMRYPHLIGGISLGSTVLRAETAGIMAIGACSLWKSCNE